MRAARQLAARLGGTLLTRTGVCQACSSGSASGAAASLQAAAAAEAGVAWRHGADRRGVATSLARQQKTYLDELASAGEASESHIAEGMGGQSNVSNEIQKALQRAEAQGGVDAVFQVVLQFSEGGDFGPVDVAAAYRQIAQAAAEQGLAGQELEGRVHRHPRFQNLVDMAMATSCSMTNKELTEVLRSAGQLHFADQMMLDRLTQRLMHSIPDLEPQQLVDAVEGLEGSDHSPGKVLFDELKHRADELAGRLTPEQKSKLKRAYEHFGYAF